MKDYNPQNAKCYLCREEPFISARWQMSQSEINEIAQTHFWEHYEYILVFIDKKTERFLDDIGQFESAREAREYARARGFRAIRDY